ncbi:MAG TPA: hypothetical protein VJ810_14715 [Blastocatellia bacterium]|nr:hypothetical protein [Blastocatellia bacterium]
MKGLRKRQSIARLALLVGFIGAACFAWLRDEAAGYQAEPLGWIEGGAGGALPAEIYFSNAHGKLGVMNVAGPIKMKGHPFFEPLGLNPRACVTCHQPAYAMSVSVEALRERWRVTKGEDPVFAPVDGSNNPKLPQAPESSHSLLLNRGLFRIGLPWPPRDYTGRPIIPEFTIEVARDPTGVNLDDTYGLKGVNPTVSVFRRPRPVANMKYVMSPGDIFDNKTGTLMAVDPDTGKPASMNLMSDARHLTLRQQANGAYRDHQEGRQGALPRGELDEIVAFENQVYMAQSHDRWGGALVEAGGPPGLGQRAMADGKIHTLADNSRDPVFRLFDAWKNPATLAKELTEAQREFRASVARGNDVFMFRQFWIRDAAHINSVGLGNPIKGTCSTCHSAQMTGQGLAPGWVDVGATNYPTWTEPPIISDKAELPVFKLTCDKSAKPHPYLGRVIYTNDPGRALITGKCVDIGSIVMGQFRGLAACAPYFSNGSAKNLRELVDFFDRRFDMKLTEQEKVDLINFLSVL